VAGDFAAQVSQVFEAQLEPGETLNGVVAATQQKTFSGSLYAIGVTGSRLLLVPLDRNLQPKAPTKSFAPDTGSAALKGAGGGWWSTGAAILDGAALRLVLWTNDGEKLNLTFMKGGGGKLGSFAGGESQAQGVQALADWLHQQFD
jgi:hypothetical protein